jgi:hypothetical protein
MEVLLESFSEGAPMSHANLDSGKIPQSEFNPLQNSQYQLESFVEWFLHMIFRSLVNNHFHTAEVRCQIFLLEASLKLLHIRNRMYLLFLVKPAHLSVKALRIENSLKTAQVSAFVHPHTIFEHVTYVAGNLLSVLGTTTPSSSSCSLAKIETFSFRKQVIWYLRSQVCVADVLNGKSSKLNGTMRLCYFV